MSNQPTRSPRPVRRPAPSAIDDPGMRTTRLANDALIDPDQAGRLASRVYARLTEFAEGLLIHDRVGRELDGPALINQAFEKLVLDPEGWWRQQGEEFKSAKQFWFMFRRVMEHLLMDHGRTMGRKRRSNGRPTIDLSAVELDERYHQYGADPARDIDLADAFRKLKGVYRQPYEVAVLRRYGQMTIPEVAKALGLSAREADKRWRFAKAFLRRELRSWGPDYGWRPSDD